MFTGIIHHLGVVLSTRRVTGGLRLELTSPFAAEPDPPRAGDSVAVDGVCLTLLADTPIDRLAFDVVPETLDRTTLGRLVPGRQVHLERAMRLGDRLDGHFVLGHVDGTATCVRVERTSQWRVRLKPPPPLSRYIVPKGSVALDGVSLTVAAIHPDGDFDVALIPTTLELTHLAALGPGDDVNLECDHLVKTIVATLERLGVSPPSPDLALADSNSRPRCPP